MFENLDDILVHYEELMMELGSPDVANDQNKFRKLMKEQSDLAPLVESYKEYKKVRQDQKDALAMLDSESDEDLREMAKEELSEAKKREEELEQELKILLKTLTMIRILCLKSEREPEEMRRLYLLLNSTECIHIMPRSITGKSI